MNLLNKYITPFKLFLVSLIIALFIIYPNIACFSWDLNHIPESADGIISFKSHLSKDVATGYEWNRAQKS